MNPCDKAGLSCSTAYIIDLLRRQVIRRLYSFFRFGERYRKEPSIVIWLQILSLSFREHEESNAIVAQADIQSYSLSSKRLSGEKSGYAE